MPRKLLNRLKDKVDPELRGYMQTVVFFAFLVIWVSLLFIITPEEVVAAIGIDGGYLLIFFTALIGASAFTSVPFYTLLFSFASTGEFNPILLGAIAAPALVFGDYLFFYLGLKTRSFLGRRFFVKPLSKWIDSRPRWAIPFVAFTYSVIGPLPQDLLMLAFGFCGVQFKRVVLPLILGNAIFIMLVAYFLSRGISW